MVTFVARTEPFAWRLPSTATFVPLFNALQVSSPSGWKSVATSGVGSGVEPNV